MRMSGGWASSEAIWSPEAKVLRRELHKLSLFCRHLLVTNILIPLAARPREAETAQAMGVPKMAAPVLA